MHRLGPTTRGSIWMATGFAVCPCHLPVTLPILLGVTARTALGAFLANNLWLIGGISTIYFILALVLGFRSLRREGKSNPPDLPRMKETEFDCCLVNEAPQALQPVTSEVRLAPQTRRRGRG